MQFKEGIKRLRESGKKSQESVSGKAAKIYLVK